MPAYPEPQKHGETVADFRHVDPDEARLGADAPSLVHVPDEDPQPTLRPTRKWIAARVVGVGAILTMFATTGTWDVEESVALIGLLTESFVSWLVPNDATEGGVPATYGD